MDKAELEEYVNESHQRNIQHKQEFHTSFESWKKDFPDAAFNSLEPKMLWDIRYNDGTPKGYIVNGFDEFKEAVKLACFCASRYQKNTDRNDICYLADQDTIKGIKTQLNAVRRTLAKLERPGPILLAAGRCTEDPIGLDWKKELQALKALLKKYQAVLKKIPTKNPAHGYSVGCLVYPSSRKPTNTPLTENMLAIQLATYIDGLLNYSNNSWFLLHQGCSVDIPVGLENTSTYCIEAIIQSIDYSLNKEMVPQEVKDTLRQKIKTGMKLCPWPELKFHP
ncbi:MAG: hypothetical protein CXR31_04525 [Geobacter sp.]|nr:MAG: hypothetical protein CXR31_04525 [Geobacter sp.]